jgi:cell division protein FtsA
MEKSNHGVADNLPSVQAQIAAAAIPLPGRILVGLGKNDADGFKLLHGESISSCDLVDGVPADFPKFVESLKLGILRAEQALNAQIFTVSVGLSGANVMGLNSKGAIFIGDSKRSISQHDIDRAIEAAGRVELPSDRTVLDVVPCSYAVDDTHDLDNPQGLEGFRLECEAHVITCRTDARDSMSKAILKAGWKPEGLFYDAWASARLDAQEPSANALFVDVSEDHTDVILTIKGHPRYSGVFPNGQRHLADELSRKLNIATRSAEAILVSDAAVSCDESFSLESGIEINVPANGGYPATIISHGELSFILESAYRPLLDSIARNLELRNLNKCVDCVLYCGYSSSVKGLVELSRTYIPARARQVMLPKAYAFQDPLVSRLTGVLQYAISKRSSSSELGPTENGGLLKKVKDYFKDFI